MESNGTGWKSLQVIGGQGKDATEADNISTIEYSPDGSYIAAGDKGGRMTLYSTKSKQANEVASSNQNGSGYDVYAKFQSHEAEFDYLKSLEIEEKINQIKWCRPSNNAQYLLSTNDKTVKLWKVHEKSIQVVSEHNANNGADLYTNSSAIRFPVVDSSQKMVKATSKRVFSNAHAYHINSIAVNSDGETYLSADDLRVNLWSLGITNQSFNIIDIKPTNMADLTEVITAADFHPSHCNIMMYSSSRGSIKLGDMREAALCDKHAKVFEEPEDPNSKSFFSEIIASISDVKFSPDGRYIIARDYLTLKIWDVNMESMPVQTINIHDQLRPKLCDLYESDCIFDKFECAVSNDGNSFITGSYNNLFHLYDRYGKLDTCIEATKGNKGRRHSMPMSALVQGANTMDAESMNFSQKVLHTAWHPTLHQVAVSTGSGLFLYGANQS